MSHKIRKFLAGLLVTLFASYYCETTLFIHTHHFLYGTVTHSHPFLPSANHTHNTAECQTIAILSAIVTTITAMTLFIAVKRRLIAIITSAPHVSAYSCRLSVAQLRAPPVTE